MFLGKIHTESSLTSAHGVSASKYSKLSTNSPLATKLMVFEILCCVSNLAIKV